MSVLRFREFWSATHAASEMIDAHYNGFALLLRSSRVKPNSELQCEVLGSTEVTRAGSKRLPGGSAVVQL